MSTTTDRAYVVRYRTVDGRWHHDASFPSLEEAVRYVAVAVESAEPTHRIARLFDDGMGAVLAYSGDDAVIVMIFSD